MKLYKRKWCPNLRWKKNKNVDKRIEICRNQHGEIRQYTDTTPIPIVLCVSLGFCLAYV